MGQGMIDRQRTANLVNIFFRPEMVGVAIARKPNFFLPLALISVFILLSNLLTIDLRIQNMIMQVPNHESLNQWGLIDNFKKLFWYFTIFKPVWIFSVIIAMQYLLRLIDSSFSLSRSISIVVHGELIRIFGELLEAVIIFLKNDISRSLSLAYPAVLLGLNSRSALYAWLVAFGFFFIWEIIAVGIILSVVLGISRIKGFRISLLVIGGLKAAWLMMQEFIWG